MRNEKKDLAILLLISLLLSIYLFFQTHVISIDGALQYIPIAKDFSSGLYGKALSHNQQPLYPFIIAFVARWLSDFELAGKLISSFFGILLIVPVYFLGKRIFDQKIAFYASFFLGIHPYLRRFSADVLKESAYLFFLATAIWFSWKTLQTEKKYPYLLIPLFSVVAYLVRPDGFEVLWVVFFYVLFIKRFSATGKKWAFLFLLLLSSALLFLPYLTHLRESTGIWTLSRAKSFAGFLGLTAASSKASFIYRILYSLKKLNFEIFATMHPLYIFLLIVGLFRRSFSHFKEGEKFLISFIILHYLILFLLILNFTNWGLEEAERTFIFSGRFVLPLLIFSIYWIGEGFLAIYEWITKKVESRHFPLGLDLKKTSIPALIILLILVLAIVFPKTLKPQRYERLPEKWAGIWIKDQYGKGVSIFTTAHRVAYYADGNYEYIDFRKDAIDQIKTSMVEKKTSYLAIREKEVINSPEVAEALKRNFIELKRFEGRGMEGIIVYKMVW